MPHNHFKEKYISKTEALNKIIEAQKETIELLTTQLRNERLKNGNLDALVRASRTNLNKTIED